MLQPNAVSTHTFAIYNENNKHEAGNHTYQRGNLRRMR
jgi:hypothetical protein